MGSASETQQQASLVGKRQVRHCLSSGGRGTVAISHWHLTCWAACEEATFAIALIMQYFKV
jgi:hypothetical protein